MVVETVSKLQSVNPEYFPGKLKHSSHSSRMSGPCSATPVGAGPAGATTHLGEKATIPAALPHLRDLLQVLLPCWLWPQCTEHACMQAPCPKLGRKAAHRSLCFLNYAQGYFYLVSKALEGPADSLTPTTPWPHHPLRWEVTPSLGEHFCFQMGKLKVV